MLIRVLLPNKEEGLFNADCQVAALLDAIKQQHKLPHEEVIDLCTRDGHVKDLQHHLSDNGREFFKLRELCLVVTVHGMETSHPIFTPVLPDYAHNEEFIAMLNHRTAHNMCVRVRLKNRPPSYPNKPFTTEAHRRTTDKAKGRKRRLSTARPHH